MQRHFLQNHENKPHKQWQEREREMGEGGQKKIGNIKLNNK